MWYTTTERYEGGEQSHLFEQQTTEFTRVHDSARRNDPARDIAIGPDGHAWILKMVPGTGDQDGPDAEYELFRFNGFEFDRVPGEGVALSVDPDGQPWLVRRSGAIARRVGEQWQELPGAATDISVGADGSVWAIGTRAVPGGHEVLHWTGEDWEEVDGGGLRVAVSPAGEPWIVDDRGFIFRRLGGRWHRVQHGAIDIAFGSDGNCWIAGIDGGKHGGNSVYRWNGRDWDKTDGAAIRIAVTPNGLPWLVNIRGGVYPRHLGR